MSKQILLQELRGAVQDLEPLAAAIGPNTSGWNGTEWPNTDLKEADQEAAVWIGILTTIAGLVDAQATPLDPKQIAFIKRTLFGGMGSFADISFRAVSRSPIARGLDVKLAKRRSAIYEALKSL
ncbi:MAG TPA: hypothetical protein VMU38_10940 [Candidatus Binatia bacterium]|nr:hypothetical protein [Candidatus Binatia bacterium]